MKINNTIIACAIILALFTLTTITGCKKENTTAVATCTDGIKNENETGIDCGGVCAACPTCSDGIKNGTETGIDCGGSCAACSSLPIVCFQQSADSSFAPVDIVFTNCSSLGTSFLWNFGDGQTSTSFSPTHAYNTIGTYTVTLTVTNAAGSSTKTSTVKIYACDLGYEGTDCKTEIRTKFLGTFHGNETCTTGTDTYTLYISSVSSPVTNIVITNVYNSNYTALATVDGQNFTMASQTIMGVTMSGTGTINGNTLTFNYTVTAGGATNSCTFTGTKL